MQPLHKINTEQRLFVLQCGAGYTCLGFDVERKRTAAIRHWLASYRYFFTPPVAEPGTEEAWSEYQNALEHAQAYCLERRTICPIDLTPELIGKEGQRVEIMDTEGNRRKVWISRSSGWMPCHIELKCINSTGGSAVCGPILSVYVLRDDRRCDGVARAWS
jgi:hypothetical protein